MIETLCSGQWTGYENPPMVHGTSKRRSTESLPTVLEVDHNCTRSHSALRLNTREALLSSITPFLVPNSRYGSSLCNPLLEWRHQGKYFVGKPWTKDSTNYAEYLLLIYDLILKIS
jgi:hypothetical protein